VKEELEQEVGAMTLGLLGLLTLNLQPITGEGLRSSQPPIVGTLQSRAALR
jgi:hypothetical protein